MHNYDQKIVIIVSNSRTIQLQFLEEMKRCFEWNKISYSIVDKHSTELIKNLKARYVLITPYNFDYGDAIKIQEKSQGDIYWIELIDSEEFGKNSFYDSLRSKEIKKLYSKKFLGNKAIELYSKGFSKDGDYISQIADHFKPKNWQPIYFTFFDFKNVIKRLNQKIIKKINDRKFKIFSSSEIENVSLTHSLVTETDRNGFSIDIREQGAYILKALDLFESNLNLTGLTYKGIQNNLFNNKELSKTIKENGLKDSTKHFDGELILLNAYTEVMPDNLNFSFITGNDDQTSKLFSVLLSLLDAQESKLVISNPEITKNLLKYFFDDIKITEKNSLIKVTRDESKYTMEQLFI